MLEHQFISFLVERIETKVGEIREQSGEESTQHAVEEVQIFIEQLKSVIGRVFEPEEPTPRAPARRSRRTSQREGGEME